jgi:hypothetical protein
MKRSGDRVIGRSGDRTQLGDVFRIAIAALREIFDESAYDRFLLRTQAARSVASYRAFLREREATVARRPKCC